MRFLENHNKHLRSLDTRNPRGLGYEPSRPEQRVRKLERPDSNSQKQKY